MAGSEEDTSDGLGGVRAAGGPHVDPALAWGDGETELAWVTVLNRQRRLASGLRRRLQVRGAVCGGGGERLDCGPCTGPKAEHRVGGGR